MSRAMFRSSAAAVQVDQSGRTIKYVFCDNSVGRDGNTISSAGWQLANFKNNPVFLWAHDAGELPIGKVIDIQASSTKLAGTVEYLTPDAYPFADTVYQLVKGGYLSATSVSWQPIDWSYSTDKTRPGGIDFKKQELLEVSRVPVPALPSALATARSRGIDTAPIFHWAERLLDIGKKTSLPRSRLLAMREAARMPIAALKLRTALTPAEELADRKTRIGDIRRRNLLRDVEAGFIKLKTPQDRAEHARKLRATFQ